MAISSMRRPAAFEPIFEAHSEDEDGFANVLLSGELDIASVPLLEQECKRIEERGGQVVSLDLGGLTFIDAGGLRAVLSAAARARDDGRPLPLVRAGQVVRRVFDLTGTGRHLDRWT